MQPRLQVFGRKARVLGNSGEHPWSDLFSVMKGEDVVRPSGSLKGSMRTRLALDAPAELEERSQDKTRFARRPLTHAAAGSAMWIAVGLAS